MKQHSRRSRGDSKRAFRDPSIRRTLAKALIASAIMGTAACGMEMEKVKEGMDDFLGEGKSACTWYFSDCAPSHAGFDAGWGGSAMGGLGISLMSTRVPIEKDGGVVDGEPEFQTSSSAIGDSPDWEGPDRIQDIRIGLPSRSPSTTGHILSPSSRRWPMRRGSVPAGSR